MTNVSRPRFLANSKRNSYLLLSLAAIGGIILMSVFSSLLFCKPFRFGDACPASPADNINDSAVVDSDGTPLPPTATPPGGPTVSGGANGGIDADIVAPDGSISTDGSSNGGSTGLNDLIEAQDGNDSMSLQVDVGGDSMTLDVESPAVLRIGNRAFNVRPQPIDETGEWVPTMKSADNAVWLRGTIINYVFALADTEENRNLILALQQTDELTMVTTQNNERAFGVSSRERRMTNDASAFAQTSPGMTLILVGLGDESAERYVVKARYLTAESAPSAGSTVGNSGTSGIIQKAEPGDVVNLGDLRVTLLGFNTRPDPTGVFEYQLVDYQIENNGGLAFDTSQLKMTLRDAAGNLYTLNGEASMSGNNPPILSTIQIAGLETATAGYKVPAGISPSTLTWQIERTNTGQAAAFSVAPEAAVVDISVVEITLRTADLSADAASLVLSGDVGNPSAQPITIEQDDVNLANADGSASYQILSGTGFPWELAPGDRVPFTLVFQRPTTATAIFTVGKQSFRLSGWQ